MRNVLYSIFVGLVIVGVLAASAAARGLAQSERGNGFTFALIGDLGYTDGQEPLFAGVMNTLNATPGLAFVVHDGDLWGNGPCTDARFQERLALLRSSTSPLVYTPGDNEWTDCYQLIRGRFDPVNRLNLIRDLFFSEGTSLGQRRLPLLRQSDDDLAHALYRENVRWSFGDVMFMTLNVPGSENNFGRTAEMDAEASERMAANLEWMRRGFEAADREGSRGLMIIWQANPGFERRPEDNVAFRPLLDALEERTVAFKKPVVLVHGDSHYFRIDKPLPAGPRGSRSTIANFTRVETFGQPDHHWLSVTVDYDDPNLFVVRQRIVDANRGCGGTGDPC